MKEGRDVMRHFPRERDLGGPRQVRAYTTHYPVPRYGTVTASPASRIADVPAIE